jgi:ATP adenylyltransferase
MKFLTIPGHPNVDTISFIHDLKSGNVSEEPEHGEELWGDAPYKNAFLMEHKAAYVKKDKKYAQQDTDSCILCNIITGDETETAFIVYKGRHNIMVLNLYPYTAGHILLAPLRHMTGYEELNADELAEFSELSQKALRVLQIYGRTESFNAGWNQGQWSGGSIKHFHLHLVPRYRTDINFIDIIGKSRTVLHPLEDVEAELKRYEPYFAGEKELEEIQ